MWFGWLAEFPMAHFPRSQESQLLAGMVSVARFVLPAGICLIAAATAAWPQQQPTQSQRPIHIVRRTVGPDAQNLRRPGPQTGSAHLGYYGGPVVSNVQVVVVFWGSGVSSTVTSGIGGFFQNITNSTYFDLLSQYASTGPTVGGGTKHKPIDWTRNLRWIVHDRTIDLQHPLLCRY